MEPPIPEEIVSLLQERVASLEQLEAMLLLRRETARRWALDEIAARLSVPEDSVSGALAELTRNGLLEQEGTSLATRWRYAPVTPQLAALVDKLAELYEQRRLEIMRMLSTQAVDRIRNAAARAFADAFVIGRKKDG